MVLLAALDFLGLQILLCQARLAEEATLTLSSVQSSSLTNGQTVPTVLGPHLTISVDGSTVTVSGGTNTATVTTPDVAAGQVQLSLNICSCFRHSWLEFVQIA